MTDKAHIQTDKQLEQMERHLSAIYSQAGKEIEETAKKYFEKFAELDEQKKKLLSDGKITEKEYKTWRQNKLMYGKRYTNLKEQISKQLANVNEIALSYVNGQLPPVYALNYNATGKGIADEVKGYSFELTDAQTVKNLATAKDIMLPEKKLDIPADMKWNAKKVNSEVLQGILQGDSMDKIAKRMQRVTDMNATSAIRNARTMVTSAENGGRLDSMRQAQEDGLEIKKEWIATTDGRVRHWHAELDGVQKAIDEPFENEFGKIMFPGDPSADGANVYNCRCTIASFVVGFAKKVAENNFVEESHKVENARETYKNSNEQEIFRFYPAKTQQEATDYMSRITKGSNSVKIGKGVTLEQENAINMALTDVYNRYGVKLGLDEVKHTTERYQGAYNPTSKTFLVKGNKTTWEKNAAKNYASNFGASGDTYQMFYHELGHAFWEELPQPAKQEIEQVYKKYTHDAYLEWMDLGGSRSGKGQADVFGKYLSRYGYQDKHEFFSECFAQIMTDYDGDAAFDVGEILDKLYVYKNR